MQPGPRCGPTEAPTSSIEHGIRIEVRELARIAARNASTSGDMRMAGSTSARPARWVASSMSRSRALTPGPHPVGGLDHAVLDLMTGLTDSSDPMAAWAPLIRPPS